MADDATRGASVRLACFPHAGGDPRLMLRWARQLPSGIEAVVLSLPREGAGGPCDGDGVRRLAADAATALQRMEPVPLCLWGHSFGAVLAYETARALSWARDAQPAALVVTGMEAPHRRVDTGIATLPDRQLLETLARYGGTPAAVLTDPDFTRAFLGPIRRDLSQLAAYRFAPGPLLRCPVTAVAGRDDLTVGRSGLLAWAELTSGATQASRVDGGHFFIQGSEDLARLLAEPLLSVVAGD